MASYLHLNLDLPYMVFEKVKPAALEAIASLNDVVPITKQQNAVQIIAAFQSANGIDLSLDAFRKGLLNIFPDDEVAALWIICCQERPVSSLASMDDVATLASAFTRHMGFDVPGTVLVAQYDKTNGSVFDQSAENVSILPLGHPELSAQCADRLLEIMMSSAR